VAGRGRAAGTGLLGGRWNEVGGFRVSGAVTYGE